MNGLAAAKIKISITFPQTLIASTGTERVVDHLTRDTVGVLLHVFILLVSLKPRFPKKRRPMRGTACHVFGLCHRTIQGWHRRYSYRVNDKDELSPGGLSLVPVVFDMRFGCLFGMVRCMMHMPLSGMGVMTGCFVVSIFMVPGCFSMVSCCVLVMFCCLMMMLCCFL